MTSQELEHPDGWKEHLHWLEESFKSGARAYGSCVSVTAGPIFNLRLGLNVPQDEDLISPHSMFEGMPTWDVMDHGDAASHRLINDELRRHRPDDAVLDEEGKEDPRRFDADRVWIIDPLDGTREFGEPGRHDWAVHVALWDRDRQGTPVEPGQLLHHSDAGSQYTSIRFTEHLELEGIAPSIGTVGDAYDNALMESLIGLFKTEAITTTVFHDGPYKTLADVEYAAAGWVDWYNHRRLHGSLGWLTPVEYEQDYYAALSREPQPA